jgi:hypothetical protein
VRTLRGSRFGTRRSGYAPLVRRCVFAVAVLALAGCGGGGSDRLSAGDYRSKADSICADANAKLNNLGNPRTPAELRALMRKARPTLKNAIDKLEALKPPEDLQSKVDTWNGKNDRLLAKYDELSKETNLIQLQSKAQELSKLNDEANRYAQTQLGLTDCATG